MALPDYGNRREDVRKNKKQAKHCTKCQEFMKVV